jgi:hypothetical protein
VPTRLSLALETAAVQQTLKTGRSDCYKTNTEVDAILLDPDSPLEDNSSKTL